MGVRFICHFGPLEVWQKNEHMANNLQKNRPSFLMKKVTQASVSNYCNRPLENFCAQRNIGQSENSSTFEVVFDEVFQTRLQLQQSEINNLWANMWLIKHGKFDCKDNLPGKELLLVQASFLFHLRIHWSCDFDLKRRFQVKYRYLNSDQ